MANPILSKREITSPHGGQVYYHWCQGCNSVHGIHTGRSQGANWTFNGNMEKPSFQSSVRCRGGQNQTTCHYFVTDGMIKYESDSPHAFAGRTVPLQPLPNWVIEEENEVNDEET